VTTDCEPNTVQPSASRRLPTLPALRQSSNVSNAVSPSHIPLDHLLSLIPHLHTRFARYDEVDQNIYQAFVDGIPNAPAIQSHESDLTDASLNYDDQAVWKRIPNTITFPTSYFQKIDSDSSAWGKAVATIDTSHTHIFSYLWNQHSYERMHRNVEIEGPDAINKIVFVPDSHSMLQAFVVNFGLALSKRVFLTWLVWNQEPDESFTIAFAPMSNYKLLNSSTAEIMNVLNDDAAAAEAIRGTVKGFWRAVPLSPEGKRAARPAG